MIEAGVTAYGEFQVVDIDSQIVLWSSNSIAMNFDPSQVDFTLRYEDKGPSSGDLCVWGNSKTKGYLYSFPVWCAGTSNDNCDKLPSHAQLKDNGDFSVISQDGEVLWHSGTAVENDYGILGPGVNPSWTKDGGLNRGFLYTNICSSKS